MPDFINKKIYSINIFIIIILTSTILLLLHTNLETNKEHTYKESYNQTDYLAQFISSDMDILIHGVHELIKGINITEEHIQEDVKHEKLITSLLKNSLQVYMLAMVMTDEKGEIIHWTENGNKIDIKNRPYINYHIKNKNIKKSLYIDQARESIAIEDKVFFAISKAFYQKDKLKNIIIAYIDIDHLIKRYSKNLINQSITIASTTGHVYVRIPKDISCCGVVLKEIDDFTKKGQNKDDQIILSTVDNKIKVASFIKSNNFPVVTSVEIEESIVLKNWNKHKLHIWLISFFIISGAGVLILYYTKLQKKVDQLTQLDSLTQIYNRGFFDLIAKKEFLKAKRFKQNLPILMIDIDDFKKINDNYGHHIGDEVIKKLALKIGTNIREIDYCSRYGGEEFIVLLTNTNIHGANIVAERIKESFKKVEENDQVIATISIGIATLDKEDKDVDDTIKRADTAMYISKKEGKDKITILA